MLPSQRVSMTWNEHERHAVLTVPKNHTYAVVVDHRDVKRYGGTTLVVPPCSTYSVWLTSSTIIILYTI